LTRLPQNASSQSHGLRSFLWNLTVLNIQRIFSIGVIQFQIFPNQTNEKYGWNGSVPLRSVTKDILNVTHSHPYPQPWADISSVSTHPPMFTVKPSFHFFGALIIAQVSPLCPSETASSPSRSNGSVVK
jgi:hypothetical protein